MAGGHIGKYGKLWCTRSIVAAELCVRRTPWAAASSAGGTCSNVHRSASCSVAAAGALQNDDVEIRLGSDQKEAPARTRTASGGGSLRARLPTRSAPCCQSKRRVRISLDDTNSSGSEVLGYTPRPVPGFAAETH